VAVVAAVAAFVVPEVFSRSNGATDVGDGQQQGPTHLLAPTNVLIVGVDEDQNTDSIVLAMVHGKSVNLVSLPRDSQVTSDGTNAKLSQIYKQSGVDALRATVSDLTGVPVDHYAVVDMAAVAGVTDAVGGVPVCLNAAVADDYAGAIFPAGEQTLNGDTALAFIRQRHGLPTGDFDRIVRLQAFLRSLANQMAGKDPRQLVSAVQGVQTDPNLDTLRLVEAMARGLNVYFSTIPVGDVDYSSELGAIVLVDPSLVKQFIASLGDKPPADHAPITPETPDLNEVAPGDVPCVN
jgi:LCP family protein required for cell wall assembly